MPTWIEALRMFNKDKPYRIPKKGTPEYNEVKRIMGADSAKPKGLGKVTKETLATVDTHRRAMEKDKGAARDRRNAKRLEADDRAKGMTEEQIAERSAMRAAKKASKK